MGEAEIRLAEERIDTAAKRLAALHDLGVDTAALHSQLAFARSRLREGGEVDVTALCDEILTTARRLAEGAAPAGAEPRPRTNRFTREQQLAETVRGVLTQGLLAKVMAEQQTMDPRVEARLQALEGAVQGRLESILSSAERTRESAQSELASQHQELQRLRQDIAQLRQGGELSGAPGAGSVSSFDQVAIAIAELIRSSAGQQERFLGAIAAAVRGIAVRSADANQAAPISAPTQTLMEGLERGFASLAQALSQRSGQPAGDAALASQGSLLEGLLAASASQLAEQQERFLAGLASGLKEMGQTVVHQTSSQGGAAVPANTDVIDTLHNGFTRLSAALTQGRPAAASASETTGTGEVVIAPGQLETAMAANVRQLADQQERFLSGLSAGLAAGLRDLGELVLQRSAGAEPAAAAGIAPLLDTLRGGIDRIVDAIGQRGPMASAPAADANDELHPTPASSLAVDLGAVNDHQTTRAFQAISTRTDREAVAAEGAGGPSVAPPAAATISTEAVRRMVANEVDAQISESKSQVEAIQVYDPEQVRIQVVAEVDRLFATRSPPPSAASSSNHGHSSAPRGAASSGARSPVLKEAELSRLLVALLPAILGEEPVRRALFSLIALEAVANPGALGELTGLRSFMRRELAIAVEEMAPAQPV